MANKNDRLVVAYYVNEAAAEAAAEDLKRWDKANSAIKLGAIAILTLDPDSGKIQYHEVGQRETKSGALWGTAIGATAAVLTGGLALIPGMLLGAGGGAIVGTFMTESVEMTDADRSTIANTLRDGFVGLAVMADDFEVAATMEKLIQFGGRPESYVVAAEIAEALTAAAEAQEAAAEAVDEAIDEAVEEAKEAVDVPGLPEEAAAIVSGLVVSIDITPEEADKLRLAGIEKGSAFYKRGATPEGREELAEETGLELDTVTTMEKKLDLMRVKGVGPKYSTLLIVSGVASVPDLARRNPENLHAKMAETNEEANIVEVLPSEEEVPDWVAQAEELPKIVVF